MEKVVGKNFEQVSPDKGEFLTIILGGIISLSLSLFPPLLPLFLIVSLLPKRLPFYEHVAFSCP